MSKVLDRPGTQPPGIGELRIESTTDDLEKLFGSSSGFDGPLWLWGYGKHSDGEGTEEDRWAALLHDGVREGCIIKADCIAVFKSENAALAYSEHIVNPYPNGKAEKKTLDEAREIAIAKKKHALALVKGSDPHEVEELHWVC